MSMMLQSVVPFLPRGYDEGRSTEAGWSRRHTDNLQRLKQIRGTVQVAVFGSTEADLLQRWSPTSQGGNFQKLFSSVIFSIPGDTTDNIRWRLQHGETEGLDAEVCLNHPTHPPRPHFVLRAQTGSRQITIDALTVSCMIDRHLAVIVYPTAELVACCWIVLNV